MGRNKIVLIAVTMLGFLFAVNAQAASDSNKPNMGKQITVIGKVYVMKDKNGNIESVKIGTKTNQLYLVILDAQGKELGKTMAGKYVEVTGSISIKNIVTWLTVEKYTEYKPKA